jgi:Family of unknown function (DUF6218)
MTLVAEDADDGLVATADYVPGVRGHAVVAIGPDADRREAIAVWRLGPTGVAVGAWVMPLDIARENPGDLHGIMTMVRGRCLVGWGTDDAVRTLDRLEDVLPPTVMSALASGVVAIPDLLVEIAEHRARYAEALEQYRSATKSKIIPLVWSREVPLDVEIARETLTPRHVGAASPVAAQALEVTGALYAAIGLWQDTESLRYRRPYLRSLGLPLALPPRWMTRLRSAADEKA